MEPLQHLLDGSTTPLWSALLLGLMTAVSPCPLATNIAAVGYIGHNAENRHRVFLAGLCYTLGRILACTALGIALIPLLRRGASLFAVERLLARYGEVLLPATLLLFGVLLLFGDRLSLPLRGGSGRKVLRCNGCGGALLLGILFSLTFCPTSALLYFGMLLPMAAAEPAGGCCPHSMLRLRDCPSRPQPGFWHTGPQESGPSTTACRVCSGDLPAWSEEA